MKVYEKDGYRVHRVDGDAYCKYWVYDHTGVVARFPSAEIAVKHVDHLTSPDQKKTEL